MPHKGAKKFFPPAGKGRGGGRRGGGLRVTAPPYYQPSNRKDPVEQLFEDMLDPQKRGPSLLVLSALRKSNIPDLGLRIWRSPAIVTLILQEILRIYPYMESQEPMPEDERRRVCSAISLFYPVVLDDRVRAHFLKASMHEYLYPFLRNPRQSKAFEHLRATSIGIIGHLIKASLSDVPRDLLCTNPDMHWMSDFKVVKILLEGGVAPLCFRCMEVGTNLSKSAAVNILERILNTAIGQEYFCGKQDRFRMINQMLASMFQVPPHKLPLTLLKQLVNCFYMLSRNSSVSGETLFNLLPALLKDGGLFYLYPGEMEMLSRCYQLLKNSTGGKYELPYF